MKITKKTIVAITTILIIVLGFAFLVNPSTSKNSTSFEIETATVEIGTVARIVSASGAVRALTTVEVGSQVSGQITELSADFNSEVTEGEIIARIDPQTFESRVASAKADVLSAEAGLAVQKANIVSAEASVTQAEKNYERLQTLYGTKAIAKSTLDDTELAVAIARANLEVSRAQLNSSKATLSQRNASLQSALVDMERTIIRSPINGVVISRNVDVGQTVAASFSAPILFTIAQNLQDIRIDAAVVEADIGGINSGDAAEFNVDAYPDQTFEGIVEQVRLASETLQNVVTYTVVIAAKNPRGLLLPGMTANVEITANKRENVLRIAETAVRFRPPINGPEVVETTQNNNQNTRRPPGGGALQILNEVDINESTRTKIQSDFSSEAQAVRESMGDRAQFDRNAMQQRMQAITEKVLRQNLSAEEYKQVQTAISQRASVTRVEAYKQTTDGKLAKQALTLGLSDGSYTEILRGAEVGQEFVTRARASQADE